MGASKSTLDLRNLEERGGCGLALDLFFVTRNTPKFKVPHVKGVEDNSPAMS